MAYDINGLGSGYAHAGEVDQQLAAYLSSAKLAGPEGMAAASEPPVWGIDISYYNGNATQMIKDAVAAGCSFVIAKASDGVQLIKGSSSDEGNYIDPQFYNNVQVAYDCGVPILGYHFFRYDNDYFQAPDPESPSSDMQWRTVKRWLGLPLHETKAPRAIQGLVTDLEMEKLSDGSWATTQVGPVVLAERLQIWMSWMKSFPRPDD